MWLSACFVLPFDLIPTSEKLRLIYSYFFKWPFLFTPACVNPHLHASASPSTTLLLHQTHFTACTIVVAYWNHLRRDPITASVAHHPQEYWKLTAQHLSACNPV